MWVSPRLGNWEETTRTRSPAPTAKPRPEATPPRLRLPDPHRRLHHPHRALRHRPGLHVALEHALAHGPHGALRVRLRALGTPDDPALHLTNGTSVGVHLLTCPSASQLVAIVSNQSDPTDRSRCRETETFSKIRMVPTTQGGTRTSRGKSAPRDSPRLPRDHDAAERREHLLEAGDRLLRHPPAPLADERQRREVHEAARVRGLVALHAVAPELEALPRVADRELERRDRAPGLTLRRLQQLYGEAHEDGLLGAVLVPLPAELRPPLPLRRLHPHVDVPRLQAARPRDPALRLHGSL